MVGYFPFNSKSLPLVLRFCPSVLLYILSTAPPIWALEMDLSQLRLRMRNGTSEHRAVGDTEVSARPVLVRPQLCRLAVCKFRTNCGCRCWSNSYW